MQRLDTPELRRAVRDLVYLLDRSYPRSSAVALVGNRYRLDRDQRTALTRGVASRAESRSRRRKHARSVRGRKLHVDCYNVLLTVTSWLAGRWVFVSTDGYLRDAAEDHGKGSGGARLEEAAALVVAHAARSGAAELLFYLDAPMAHSGRTAELLREEMTRRGVRGSAVVSRSPDHDLKQVSEGIVASADSAIIDACSVPVYDLARAVLERRFAPRLVRLGRR